jgi:large subunit ribosomal protein L17
MKDLIMHDKITTTQARAKELRPFIERAVTRAKRDTLASRRVIHARLGNSEIATDKLFDTIAPKFAKREGGYTRIIKLAPRSARGDASPMAVIEFVD